MDSFDRRLRRLTHLHPSLEKGAMSWRSLVALAHRVSSAEGREAAIKLRPWPFLGSVSRNDERFTFSVDSRQGPDRRRQILAHEIGHVALGHYLTDEGIWYYTDAPGDNLWEQEADVFEMIALRSACVPLDHIVPPEQMLLSIGTRLMPTIPKLKVKESVAPARVRTAGTGRPQPAVQRILRLFDEPGE